MTNAEPSSIALRRTLGPWTLWGLGVGYVISGEYFGWNLGLPHGGIWRGHQGFSDLFDVVVERWQEFEVVYNDTKWNQIDSRRILTEGRLRGVVRADGRPVLMPVVSIFTFTERGLSHLDHFYQDTAAIVCPRSA